MNASQDPAQVFGYDVTDPAGNKIGNVDNVWVDDATSELEFVGVKTGWLMGKTHVIPVANAQISNGQIRVPFAEEQIKNAPGFSGDQELSPEQEEEIYSYYGQERTTAPSPTGLPAGTSTGGEFSDTTTTGYGTTGTGDQSLTLHEEELQVGKREVEAGRVRLRKVVRTEHEEVPVELRREDVQIERVPATGMTGTDTAFQEEEIDVPVMREEAVVGKEAHATEQVRLNKSVDTETQTVGGDVRREEVETEGDNTTFGNRGDFSTKRQDTNY